ncbi:glycine betaine ABC transporter substrate-binding protein [Brevibacillus humidisoli]|uniref:glycine betaine ABC transporter substrate-binding protein n=1 Tax=Brevibacillus humidisoli TaxID=2895522 RepID=UPI001E5EDA67|nr:glycine betaine ABC transporter substrate-binding protein [Brevibacillus humidisoli]UFJ40309.1 glycine betaine ABC transporter substrate-binding protein [Brevibacillus humidisoli]
MKARSGFGPLCLLFLAVTIVMSGGCATQPGGDQPGGAAEEAEKPTITIGKVPFEHEWVPVAIIQEVAKELGYATKIEEGDVGVVFLGLSTGDINVYPDVWLPTLHASYMEKYEGKIDLAGTVYQKAPTGWAVPTYVDINSIADLKGKSETFNGQVVGVEPGAGMMVTSEKTIQSYGLTDYKLLSGSTPAMLAAVKKATDNQEPIVFLAWRPHTMFQDFDIKMLEDPKGVWAYDDCRIGTSTDLKEKAPDLYSFLQNFRISMDEIESFLVKMDKENADVNDLAKEWIEQNRNDIDKWIGK